MVTVGETLSLKEEFLSCSLVEHSASFGAERHVGDVEVGILSPLDPVRPLVALDAVIRPVPTILGLDEPKFTVKPEGHD